MGDYLILILVYVISQTFLFGHHFPIRRQNENLLIRNSILYVCFYFKDHSKIILILWFSYNIKPFSHNFMSTLWFLRTLNGCTTFAVGDIRVIPISKKALFILIQCVSKMSFSPLFYKPFFLQNKCNILVFTFLTNPFGFSLFIIRTKFKFSIKITFINLY